MCKVTPHRMYIGIKTLAAVFMIVAGFCGVCILCLLLAIAGAFLYDPTLGLVVALPMSVSIVILLTYALIAWVMSEILLLIRNVAIDTRLSIRHLQVISQHTIKP